MAYRQNFPNSERYISILKEITDQAVVEKRAAIREQILAQPNLRTGDSDSHEGQHNGEEEEEGEEGGWANRKKGKRKEKFAWNGAFAALGKGSIEKKERGEDDKADDEDDKEETEKQEAKKTPKETS